MLLSECSVNTVSLIAALWGLAVEAADFKRLDGVHRLAKQAQITQHAILHEKKDDVCGTGMKLCPSSLGGDCCPDNYACATNSCYATTRNPVSCGTKRGWHACDKVYGAGCCPDGFICQTADGCVLPTGSPYTYSCPSNQHLCPSSVGYGCCPNGMACGANQCYSTQPTTITLARTVTTTESGLTTTYTTTATTVRSPTIPTAFSTVNAQQSDDQAVFKYYPTSVPKFTPSLNQTEEDSSHSSLSGAQLGGIVGGAVAFLIFVVIIACVFIRRLNKLAKRVEGSKKPRPSKPVAEMKQPIVTETEVDDTGFDTSKRPSQTLQHQNSAPEIQPGQSWQSTPGTVTVSSLSNGHTNTSGDDRAHMSPDTLRGRVSDISWRPVSDLSDAFTDNATMAELEARSCGPELPGSTSAVLTHAERPVPPNDRPGVMTRPPLSHQWMKSVGLLRRTGSIVPGQLDIVDEEWHGFHGPKDYMAGQTAVGRAQGSGSEGKRDSDVPKKQ